MYVKNGVKVSKPSKIKLPNGQTALNPSNDILVDMGYFPYQEPQYNPEKEKLGDFVYSANTATRAVIQKTQEEIDKEKKDKDKAKARNQLLEAAARIVMGQPVTQKDIDAATDYLA